MRICVHDITGITYTRASLALEDAWKTHGCDYCTQAKACVGTRRCMEQKRLAMYWLKKRGMRPYFGVCNMGVCEYILPVILQGQLLAVIFAGGVTLEDRDHARSKLLSSLEGKPSLLCEETLAAYDRFCDQYFTSREALRFLAELVRDRLAEEIPEFSAYQPEEKYPVEAVSRRPSSLVIAIIKNIESTLPDPVSLQDLASSFFISKGHLCRIFRAEMGTSVLHYTTQLRIRRACEELIRSDRTIARIASSVGLEDPNYFSRVFRAYMGMSPTEYRLHAQKE